MIGTVGQKTISIATSAGKFSHFFLRTLSALFHRPLEVRMLIQQMESVGVQSFSVVGVTALFTGMVFTLQTYDGFERFQAEGFVPGVLGVALARELIPVLCGLMVAGRVGSAMAAELGTMKVTDQISALEAMATDPIRFLVFPRFIATICMLPLLIAIGDLIGLLGGWYLITAIIGDPMPSFLDRAFEMMDGEDFWSGLVKAACFGGIIASVGCYQGLNVTKGAAGVGSGTTNAVVYASLGILVSDFFITKVFFS